VFFVGVWFVGSRKRRIRHVVAWYSENFGNYLVFKAYDTAHGIFYSYKFDINLLAPNYVPVTPMPVASIENEFRIELGYVLERRYLVNKGYGYVSKSNSHYTIGLGNQNSSCFVYSVEITNKKAGLNNFGYACDTQLPMPAPVSSLF
jgi:hypothetical protein